jgi:hypothetical protein
VSLCLVLMLASPLKKVFLALDFVAREVLFLHEILTHQIARSSSLSTHAPRCASSRFDLGFGGFFVCSVAAFIGRLFAVLCLHACEAVSLPVLRVDCGLLVTPSVCIPRIQFDFSSSSSSSSSSFSAAA